MISSDPKINAWVQQEYQHDQGYWQNRAKNGSGLIQQIAIFIIKQGNNHEQKKEQKRSPHPVK